MHHLSLGRWETRDYGSRREGVVNRDGHIVKIRVRKPSNDIPDSGLLYVMANGWTTGRGSMRATAIEATKAGHTAVTLDYTNTGRKTALDENVKDVTAVLDAMPAGYRRGGIGLSMGGAVMTMAMNRVSTPLEIATLVAPAKYIKPEYYKKMEILRRAAAELKEVSHIGIGTRPSMALSLGRTTLGNCARRPTAIPAELRDLLLDTVHSDLRQAKAQPDAPYIRFAYGLHDNLLPPGPQRTSIEGLPFDDIMPYEGGHARLAYDDTLARHIFQLDTAVIAKPGPSEGSFHAVA